MIVIVRAQNLYFDTLPKRRAKSERKRWPEDRAVVAWVLERTQLKFRTTSFDLAMHTVRYCYLVKALLFRCWFALVSLDTSTKVLVYLCTYLCSWIIKWKHLYYRPTLATSFCTHSYIFNFALFTTPAQQSADKMEIIFYFICLFVCLFVGWLSLLMLTHLHEKLKNSPLSTLDARC